MGWPRPRVEVGDGLDVGEGEAVLVAGALEVAGARVARPALAPVVEAGATAVLVGTALSGARLAASDSPAAGVEASAAVVHSSSACTGKMSAEVASSRQPPPDMRTSTVTASATTATRAPTTASERHGCGAGGSITGISSVSSDMDTKGRGSRRAAANEAITTTVKP